MMIQKGKSIFLFLLMSFLFACKKENPNLNTDNQEETESNSVTENSSTIKKIDSSKYEEAKIFPGLVGEKVSRVHDFTVSLDLNYKEWKNLSIVQPPQPLFSTKLYAPAGEPVIIEVPEGLNNVYVQIGAWTDDLNNHGQQGRSPLIYTKDKLNPGIDTIGNLYGGPIYIVPTKPISKEISFIFTGAVEMPNFVLDETNPTTWWEKVQNTDVPWLELSADNISITLPRKKILEEDIKDPSALLSFWNTGVKKDFLEWTGISETADKGKLPFRVIFDNQESHAGSPIILNNSSFGIKNISDVSTLEKGDVGLLYNLWGQNEMQPNVWTWKEIQNAAANIFTMHAIHRLPNAVFGSLNSLFPLEISEIFDYINQTNGDKKFDNPQHSEVFKMLPFIQIFEKAVPASGNGSNGYDFIPFLYQAARDLNDLPTTKQEKKDFFYETLSAFLKKDAQLFFDTWGIAVSQKVRDQVADRGYDLLTQKIWTYNPVADTGGTAELSDHYFYQNTNWHILEVNSQDERGEGSGNGPATNIIDGDSHSYWHTNYGKGTGTQAFPFYVAVDMQKKLAVKSFTFTQRLGNTGDELRHIKNIEVAISQNGENWNILDTFRLEDLQIPQSFNLKEEKKFKYFRLRINSKEDVYDGKNFAALAEVNVADTFAILQKDFYNPIYWEATASSVGQTAQEYDPVSNIIDGKEKTFWSASWTAPSPEEPPYWVVINMQKKLQIASVNITQRQTGNKKSRINELNLYSSEDGINWEKIGAYTLDVNNLDPQQLDLPSIDTFQYFKIEIEDKSKTGGDEPAIAEISVNGN